MRRVRKEPRPAFEPPHSYNKHVGVASAEFLKHWRVSEQLNGQRLEVGEVDQPSLEHRLPVVLNHEDAKLRNEQRVNLRHVQYV